jgi:GntR family transcriptional regulator/MocR family aminotransferase
MIEVQGSRAGLHLVVWFNNVDATQEDEIASRGRQKGVGVYPISGLYGDDRAGDSIRRAGFVC